jgi:hypothetical protein
LIFLAKKLRKDKSKGGIEYSQYKNWRLFERKMDGKERVMA